MYYLMVPDPEKFTGLTRFIKSTRLTDLMDDKNNKYKANERTRKIHSNSDKLRSATYGMWLSIHVY